jgi:hypothetical protein
VYYHPALLQVFDAHRFADTCVAMAQAWMAGVERHRAAHIEAVREFCDGHVEAARNVLDAADSIQLAVRSLSSAATDPLKFVAAASTFGEIAADTHRRVINLIEAHTAELVHRRDGPTDRVRERPMRATSGNRHDKQAGMVDVIEAQ